MKKEKTEDQKLTAAFKAKYPIGALLFRCVSDHNDENGPRAHRIIRHSRRWSDQTNCMMQTVTVEVVGEEKKRMPEVFRHVESDFGRKRAWFHDLETLHTTPSKAVKARIAQIEKDQADHRAAADKHTREYSARIAQLKKFK